MDTLTALPGHQSPPRLLAAACITLVMLLTGGSAAHAATARPGAIIPDSRRVSFAGPAVASAASESVDVVGTLQVVTVLAGSDHSGWTLVWYANLSNTTGTGQTTGDRYRGTGADAGFVRLPPGPPVREASFEPACRLTPLDRTHPPSPCRLLVTVQFGTNGRVSNVGAHTDHGVIGPVD